MYKHLLIIVVAVVVGASSLKAKAIFWHPAAYIPSLRSLGSYCFWTVVLQKTVLKAIGRRWR